VDSRSDPSYREGVVVPPSVLASTWAVGVPTRAAQRGLAGAVCVAALLSSACASLCPVVPAAERTAFLDLKGEGASYVVSPGDQIQVEVWQNTQLTRQVTVRPDGMISLPLVNDVPAAGQTVAEFQDKLTERLKQYLRDPVVSVNVSAFTTTAKQIYIQGQVRTPAAFGYRPDMTVLQALALSGGANAFAEGCAVIVRQRGGQFYRYTIELEPMIRGDSLKENIVLLPNDVLTVH
jgi:polysaccharide export outer membrane protein